MSLETFDLKVMHPVDTPCCRRLFNVRWFWLFGKEACLPLKVERVNTPWCEVVLVIFSINQSRSRQDEADA